MFRKKKIFTIITLVLTLMLLVSCTNGGALSGDSKKEDDTVIVSFVTVGELGDLGFNDACNVGLEKASQEFGVETQVFEAKEDTKVMPDLLEQAAETSDIVIVTGHEFYNLVKDIAPSYSNVQFFYIDDAIEGYDNVTSVIFKANEGSFLAGALAAMKSKTGAIGFIGGDDYSVIRSFETGYKAGAEYINPDIQIKSLMVGNFEDPSAGKEAALALYSKGCDIIFTVSGDTGMGVFEAAAETGNYAIGVDSDQRHINPDAIIASMVKDLDGSIYDMINRTLNDTLEEGTVYMYDLSNGGVDLTYGDDTMPEIVTPEEKDVINQIKEAIIFGKLEVPEYEFVLY